MKGNKLIRGPVVLQVIKFMTQVQVISPEWLCKVTGYWQELKPVQIDAEHCNHAQWVTCLPSVQVMKELRCFWRLRIVLRSLEHGSVHYHGAT